MKKKKEFVQITVFILFQLSKRAALYCVEEQTKLHYFASEQTRLVSALYCVGEQTKLHYFTSEQTRLVSALYCMGEQTMLITSRVSRQDCITSRVSRQGCIILLSEQTRLGIARMCAYNTKFYRKISRQNCKRTCREQMGLSITLYMEQTGVHNTLQEVNRAVQCTVYSLTSSKEQTGLHYTMQGADMVV